MKCSEFRKFLVAYGDHAGRLGSGQPAGMNVVLSLLEIAPAKTVADVAKRIRVAGSQPRSTRFSILWSLHDFLKPIAKPAYTKDLADLLGALDTRADLHSLEGVAAAVRDAFSKAKPKTAGAGASKAAGVRPDVVASHVRKLETALGDDLGFRSAMSALEVDKTVSSKEIIAIAKAFAFKAAKSRDAALKGIWGRHQNLMSSGAKSAATGGRIAG